MKLKRFLTLALAALMLLAVSAGCSVYKMGSGARMNHTEESAGSLSGKTGIKEEPEQDEAALFSFAVDGYVLERDAKYRYAYNEAGLCIEARDAASGALVCTFDYAYDAEGRPTARYMEKDGERTILEEYDYDKNGSLTELRYYEEGELRSLWKYDSKGRVTAGQSLPVTTPYAPGFLGSTLENVEWDDADRLISVTFPMDKSLDELAWLSNLTQEEFQARRDELEHFISSNHIKTVDGLYRIEAYTEEYEYDENGRMTKYVVTRVVPPLGNFLQTQRTEERRTEDTYRVRYSRDGFRIKFTRRAYNGSQWQDSDLNVEFDHEIEFDPTGLPVSVQGIDTNIYAALACSVKSAEAGLFGISWCPAYTNYLGELHGGFAGLDPSNLQSYAQQGMLQSLRVAGEGPDGEEINYVIWPDAYGRQRCQKLTDGRLTMNVSEAMDRDRQKSYVMDEDRDEFVYRRLS